MNRERARLLELAEHNFRQIRHCCRCRRLLVLGHAERRAYESPHGVLLIRLCNECAAEIPAGSPAEDDLRRAVAERFK